MDDKNKNNKKSGLIVFLIIVIILVLMVVILKGMGCDPDFTGWCMWGAIFVGGGFVLLS